MQPEQNDPTQPLTQPTPVTTPAQVQQATNTQNPATSTPDPTAPSFAAPRYDDISSETTAQPEAMSVNTPAAANPFATTAPGASIDGFSAQPTTQATETPLPAQSPAMTPTVPTMNDVTPAQQPTMPAVDASLGSTAVETSMAAPVAPESPASTTPAPTAKPSFMDRIKGLFGKK